jgi:hypothetical protein
MSKKERKKNIKLKSFMTLQTALCRWCQCDVFLGHTKLCSGQLSHASKSDLCNLFMLTRYEMTETGHDGLTTLQIHSIAFVSSH